MYIGFVVAMVLLIIGWLNAELSLERNGRMNGYLGEGKMLQLVLLQ